MTGRDLILYILENNLEDEPVYKDGKLIGFQTVSEYATNHDVGNATVLGWITLHQLSVIKLGDTILIPIFGGSKCER